MTWKPPLLPDHYAAGESQKSMIYSYLLFLWYVRLDRTGVKNENHSELRFAVIFVGYTDKPNAYQVYKITQN